MFLVSYSLHAGINANIIYGKIEYSVKASSDFLSNINFSCVFQVNKRQFGRETLQSIRWQFETFSIPSPHFSQHNSVGANHDWEKI